jgi:hypothetical protein
MTTHIFEEDLEDTTGLFVDETRNTFDTTTTGETTNSGLCDTLDVVAENFPVALSTTLSESFSTLLQLKIRHKRRNSCQRYSPFRVQTLLIKCCW